MTEKKNTHDCFLSNLEEVSIYKQEYLFFVVFTKYLDRKLRELKLMILKQYKIHK